MSKLKKMLLISSLIALSSCAAVFPGLPDPPEAKRIVPIWKNTKTANPEVIYFHGILMNAQTKFDWTNRQAYDAGLVCTDIATYDAYQAYIAEVQRLVSERCR